MLESTKSFRAPVLGPESRLDMQQNSKHMQLKNKKRVNGVGRRPEIREIRKRAKKSGRKKDETKCSIKK